MHVIVMDLIPNRVVCRLVTMLYGCIYDQRSRSKLGSGNSRGGYQSVEGQLLIGRVWVAHVGIFGAVLAIGSRVPLPTVA